MKFKKAFALILALLCTVSLFSACGSANAEADINRAPSSPVMDKLTSESITEDSFYLEYAEESYIEASKNNGLTFDSADGETNNTSSLQLGTPDPSRKLIYHVNYSLETKTFDSSVTSLLALTESLGGYTESSDTRGGNGSERYATYVLRIPSEKLTDFIAGVGNIGSILSESLSTEDVTLEYVDIESHLTSLRAQETRLLELLSEAKDLSEVLMIEESLTGVRYEIESYTTRLNTISSLVSYSTVTVSLREVIEYTPIVT
ncbi:MAG: DUF4349 domain-containing protein, partial [Clostridia bacterium]|nr:DUF4349 domain-containing protein [Clostridia bacterium]